MKIALTSSRGKMVYFIKNTSWNKFFYLLKRDKEMFSQEF